MESDLQGRVGIQEGNRIAFVSLKLRRRKKKKTSLSCTAGRWSELARGSSNMASAKNPSGKTFSGWLPTKSKGWTPPKSKLCARHNSNPCVCVHTGTWKQKKEEKESGSRLNIYSKSQQVRRETEEKQNKIPAEQNRPKELVPYQVECVQVSGLMCMWKKPYGFVANICPQPTNTKICSILFIYLFLAPQFSPLTFHGLWFKNIKRVMIWLWRSGWPRKALKPFRRGSSFNSLWVKEVKESRKKYITVSEIGGKAAVIKTVFVCAL